MGKSYKKSNALSEMNYQGAKRRANKKVRQALKNPDIDLSHKEYKKVFCSWDVRDYSEVAPSFEVFCEQQIDRWFHLNNWIWKYNKDRVPPEPYPTRKELWEKYQRWYKRK